MQHQFREMHIFKEELNMWGDTMYLLRGGKKRGTWHAWVNLNFHLVCVCFIVWTWNHFWLLRNIMGLGQHICLSQPALSAQLDGCLCALTTTTWCFNQCPTWLLHLAFHTYFFSSVCFLFLISPFVSFSFPLSSVQFSISHLSRLSILTLSCLCLVCWTFS